MRKLIIQNNIITLGMIYHNRVYTDLDSIQRQQMEIKYVYAQVVWA